MDELVLERAKEPLGRLGILARTLFHTPPTIRMARALYALLALDRIGGQCVNVSGCPLSTVQVNAADKQHLIVVSPTANVLDTVLCGLGIGPPK